MPDPHMTRPISRFCQGSGFIRVDDELIVEEPLEIRLNSEPLTITMRTPGHDLELTAGLLLAEGIVASSEDIESIRHCTASANIVRAELRPGLFFDQGRITRSFPSSSSCGLCGKASLDALAITRSPFLDTPALPEEHILLSMPLAMREEQTLFRVTGSSHSAGLFDAQGKLLSLYEDVGRHNAVDKVIGRHVLNATPVESSHILCVSGRVSFEIMQKAISARVRTIVAVGAPSSLSVEMAIRFRMNLVGFVSQQHFNVYA